MPVVLLASLDCLADFRIDVINRADTIDFSVLALLDVEILQWKGLTVVCVKTLLGCLLIVVSTSAGLSTCNDARDKLRVVNLQSDYC